MNWKQRLKTTGLFKAVNRYRWRERMTHPGKENPERTFYCIRRHADHAGLFSFVCTNLGSCAEAQKRGMVPVVDMCHSVNPMLEEGELDRVNPWEKLFLQPGGVTLSEMERSKNVVLSPIDPPESFPDYWMFDNPGEVDYWREEAKKWIRVRPEIEADAERYIRDVIGVRRVLGVLARGTDYTASRPKNHPIQPEVPDLIARCRAVMEEHKLELVYLATEDADIWEAFEKAFPGKVICYQSVRYKLREGENINDVGNVTQGAYRRNREYLTSILVLSRCHCFVGGATSGTYGALLLGEPYEYSYVYRLGRYD